MSYNTRHRIGRIGMVVTLAAWAGYMGLRYAQTGEFRLEWLAPFGLAALLIGALR